MWPVKVQRQFDIAQAAGTDALENVMHAPYNKLLNTLFPVDTDFTVIPNFQEINSTKGVDHLMTFEIFLENRPVFLRGRLGDLIDACPLPVLHGVSAFGAKLCFYSLTQAGLISPESIPAPTQYVIDTAPVDRWNYNILTAEGEAELRRIVQVITTECAQLPR
ncbi:hypothetical protein F4604DRAFT_1930330 [Suillus subluteus]|nr:hypothetical protein F4604DRAFT_1930330 [Suillus subluteus]